jgi:hypothetical protein
MGQSMSAATSDRHRVISEIAPEMLHADLRNPETDDLQAEIGACLDYARRFVGWNLEQLANALPAPEGKDQRDPRQVRRWIDGKERPQLDVIFAVRELRGPFVIGLAKLAALDMETTIRIPRIA